MKAVGIFGGTFDPVHHGHLITARAVMELRDLEKIVFIPANISPHKTHTLSSSAEHRYNMLSAATEGIPYFEISRIEIDSGGISYTVDTLGKLKHQYGKMELIIGYDNLLKFNTWKDPQHILELASLIVLRRHHREEKTFRGAEYVETPLIKISSTDIRNRTAGGLPINFLVPEKVMEYIYTFNLYRQDK